MENENNQANSNNIIQTFTFKDYNKTTERSTFRKLSALVKIHEDIKKDEENGLRLRMDWTNYHRLDVIHSFIDDLEFDFPSICTSFVIGKSLEGRDLKLLKISNSNANNASVWLDAGIHAREWIAPAVATYIADYITRNFNDMPECITNKDWYILPVMNPDGYEYSHTKDRMWRKNRAWHGGQCVGVDLNRNFSIGWGQKASSDNPTNNFYRGPEPFSEPESSAVRGIYDFNGNTYKVGISKDVMYGAAGTSNDWSYGELGIPYCYLIELRSKKHKFRLPKEEINETSNEIWNSIKALMEFVDDTDSQEKIIA